MLKELSLQGKTALVTGGGTGLGFAIARELAELGAAVILSGRREEVLREACGKIPNARWKRMDLSAGEAVAAQARELEEEMGPVDILVNNAGIQNNKHALEFSHADFQDMFDVHVFGAFVLTRELAKGMAERGGGSVVFITSAASHMGLTKTAAYTGAKGALSALVRTLASELSPRGVRVNAVAPGWIMTELMEETKRRVPERIAQVERRVLAGGELGTPKDIGMAVAFLASDAARYITAAELKVDGGIGVSL